MGCRPVVLAAVFLTFEDYSSAWYSALYFAQNGYNLQVSFSPFICDDVVVVQQLSTFEGATSTHYKKLRPISR